MNMDEFGDTFGVLLPVQTHLIPNLN